MGTNKAALCAVAAAAVLNIAPASTASSIASRTSTSGGMMNTKIMDDAYCLSVRGGFSKSEDKTDRKKKRKMKRKNKKGSEENVLPGNSTATPTPLREEAHDSSQQTQTPPPSTEESKATPKARSRQQQASEPPKSSKKSQPEASTPPIVQEILKENDYYKILGITKQATAQSPESVIKKAYLRRTVHTHPDKTGGDRRAFDKVAEAYEVLSDDSKRQVYDRFGKRGLEQQQQGGGGGFPSHTEDLFRSFFGGNHATSRPQQPSRNRTTRYQLEVTLEDLYKGLVKTVLVSPPEERPFAMRQQPTTKRAQVQVPRGALNGQSIVMSGEMDFDAKDTPGDLVLILKQRPHATFTRKGHDLAISVKVSLKEAICGVHGTIRHLDGRNVSFASARRNDAAPILIKTGDVQVLKGQGMPKNARGTEFGDLYVQYNVVLPSTAARQEMTPNERAELGRLLDKLEGKQSSSVEEIDDSNVDVLTQASLSDFGIASGTPEVPPDPTSMEEEGPGFSPFGSRQFYFPSGSPSPFFGMRQGPMYEEDDSNVQCRQM
jgi:DnaJ-class molecular chaperone